MSRPPICVLDLAEQIHEHVQQLNAYSIPVIVEGKKDQRALSHLGIRHCLTLNKPLFQVVESLSCREVALLTDFDKEGKALYGKLQKECLHRGIKINNKLRHFLLRETPLSTVEGLTTFLSHQNLRKL